ncbi:endospore germination permease [Serpentinicella sp. ANB-PHB4]|uniref:GerAB/ArcD/ProY family transporter n=1 Tax=Serpentinicella sp. ANB-PHB4 TaxID=3074076 RepID=UPI002864C757|nr:endospore germination permease [Serpentinicella sp. ANB-PHB4]MDR5659444.1 endospore germination permease [Serpentinicella sp. ANB-PHB4]
MEKELNGVDMLAFVVHGTVGIRLLTIPRDIVEIGSNNGWMSVALSAVIAFYLGFSFYWLYTKHPNLNISQIIEANLGKKIGKIIMVAIAIYIISTIGLSLRAFTDSVKMFLLDTTPRSVLVILGALPIVYGVSKGIKTLSIVLDLLLPLVILSTILLVVLASTSVDLENYRPVLHEGLMPVLKGSLQMVHPLLGIGIIGYIMPQFNEPKRVKKWIGIGVLISIGSYLAIVTLSILVFGSEETKMLIWPTISLSKAIQLETELFERAESLFMTMWIPIAFTTMVTFYYSSTLNLKVLFDSNRDHLITYGQIPLFILIAVLPNSVVDNYKYLGWVNLLAMFFAFIIIPLVIVITLFKNRRVSNEKT